MTVRSTNAKWAVKAMKKRLQENKPIRSLVKYLSAVNAKLTFAKPFVFED